MLSDTPTLAKEDWKNKSRPMEISQEIFDELVHDAIKDLINSGLEKRELPNLFVQVLLF